MSKRCSQPYLLIWEESVENGSHMDPLRVPLMPVVLMSRDLEQSAFVNNAAFTLSVLNCMVSQHSCDLSLKRQDETKNSALKSLKIFILKLRKLKINLTLFDIPIKEYHNWMNEIVKSNTTIRHI